ncbi:MAG: putative carboxymuconolactone decarboxylase [Actinomycetia bacterium]|nr:putative carboxymuconolactone decarboxylase [Actinomycetes bacterium]
MTEPEDGRRERGKGLMRDVYGWDFEPTRPFELQTVDHLFGEVWAEGKLSVRDRRLVLIGMAAGSGLEDVAALQLDAAMTLGELDADDLRTLVVFLAHYAGWPRAAKLNTEVENLIARQAKAAAEAAAKAAAVEADTDAGPVT